MRNLIASIILLLTSFLAEAQSDTIRYGNGQIKGIGEKVDGKKQGNWHYFYASSQLESEGNFENDLRKGQWKWYHENGQLMSIENYENGRFENGDFWNEAGLVSTIDEIIIRPYYPKGGMSGFNSYLSENIKYPKLAKKERIEGQVIVDFTVNKNGDLGGFKIYESTNTLFDDEALRVIKESEKWIPGTFHGEKVKVIMRIPITFAFDEKKNN